MKRITARRDGYRETNAEVETNRERDRLRQRQMRKAGRGGDVDKEEEGRHRSGRTGRGYTQQIHVGTQNSDNFRIGFRQRCGEQ